MLPVVSVIIPAFNSGKHVSQTIESLLTQTCTDWEAIIVDDGSTDNTAAIVSQFSAKDKRIKLIRQHNHGSPIAKNKGIQAASGKYIQFLDSDDLLSPDKIANQVAILENQKESIVWCSTRKFIDPSEIESDQTVLIEDHQLRNIIDPIEFILVLNGVNGRIGMVQPNAYMFEKGLLEKSGLWAESLRRSPDDDSEFFTRVILNSRGVIYDPKSLNFYRQPSVGSLSQKKSSEAAFGALQTVLLKFGEIKRWVDQKEVNTLFANHLSLCAYQYGQNHPELVDSVEREIIKIGFARILPVGGKYFSVVAKIISFKNALRLKRAFGKQRREAIESKFTL